MKCTLNTTIIVLGTIVVLGFLLLGCDRTPKPQIQLIKTTRESLKIKLDENFIFNDCGKVTHREYYYPTEEWIISKFIPYWFEYRNRNKLMYNIDATNCESFSFQAHFASQEIERIKIAFGVFFYQPSVFKNTNIGHAVNIVLLNTGEKIELRFFEPQTSKFINLSLDEIASCSFFYF